MIALTLKKFCRIGRESDLHLQKFDVRKKIKMKPCRGVSGWKNLEEEKELEWRDNGEGKSRRGKEEKLQQCGGEKAKIN